MKIVLTNSLKPLLNNFIKESQSIDAFYNREYLERITFYTAKASTPLRFFII